MAPFDARTPPQAQPDPGPPEPLNATTRRHEPGAPAHRSPGPGPRAEFDPETGWESADLFAAGVLDAVPGDPPVPISVWRASGPHDPPTSPTAIFGGLTHRLAAMLLAIWTDPGQMVIDTTDDPSVAGAAGAGGRHYLSLDLPPAPPAARDLNGRAGLILLRWPSTDVGPGARAGSGAAGTPATGGDPSGVLAACRDLLCPDGHTVVVLTPPTGGVYRDYARIIIPAARTAGLGYLQHLIVITAQDDPAAATPSQEHPAGSVAARGHLDVLVFVLRHGNRP